METNIVPDVVFSSRRIPGSVVVYKNGAASVIIFRFKDDEAIRVAFPVPGRISPETGKEIEAIPPGPYKEVKEKVLKILTAT